ncbi:transglycosylase domain-containing protein [Streptomyces sp. NBC_01716]|uniref:transglycosylase domain-containing protein n=1 Tax=Streptomyces sp. NBC_01716 TaxID=2975917 RepID=UPI002E2EEFF2|nr:transglycosylase domain-containing protein [Streptomyces sp. NBC_01716]
MRMRLRRLLTWRKALIAFVTLCLLVLAAFTVLYLVIDIPRPNEQVKAQSNVYLFADGSRLARTGEVNRESVPLDRVPGDVRRAFVAAENKDFYSDSGVSLSGTARGVFSTLTGGGKQGGSTITQQYVKNYYLSQEQTVTRKVKELFISLKVDRHNSKDDILAGYLNSSYYGRLAYGVQAAARTYYGKEVEDLGVEEGAYLAALLQAPSQYDWAVASPADKKKAKARWGYVLDNMVGEGWLDKDERRRMRFPVPVAPKASAELAGDAGYLVDTARRELIAAGVGEQELAGGGWRITLNIDPDRQRALREAVTAGLTSPGDAAEPEPKAPRRDPDRQAGAVSVDPESGRIVALYGGDDYFKHYLNNATRADYQAGPTFAPVVLAAGIEAKKNGRSRVGRDMIRQTAKKLGMTADPAGFAAPQATSLGLMGASPLEMAGVHATLANDGKKVTPSIVKSARRGDRTVELPEATGEQAVGSASARFAHASASGIPRPVGGTWPGMSVPPLTDAAQVGGSTGASGHTDDRKAEWFIGSAPEEVTSIALFGESAKTGKQVALTGIEDDPTEYIWSVYLKARAAEPAEREGS